MEKYTEAGRYSRIAEEIGERMVTMSRCNLGRPCGQGCLIVGTLVLKGVGVYHIDGNGDKYVVDCVDSIGRVTFEVPKCIFDYVCPDNWAELVDNLYRLGVEESTLRETDPDSDEEDKINDN